MDKNIYGLIISKREFSKLPEKDVELAFSHFEKRQVSDEEKIRLTRELLHKVFGAFGSRKLLNLKYKSPDWVLKKHLSTRERIGFYEDFYSRIIKNQRVIFDLGAGVNGFSYNYFKNKPKYIAIEAVGQWVDLMNYYFKKEKINGRAINLSLFELKKVKEIIKKEQGKKIIFLFKTLDVLEMLQRDYSKKLLIELVPLVDKVVLSFSTESMIKRKKFKAGRKWILNFIEENFVILDDFELRGEKFIVFHKR
ncbi:MAG: hypothetical protein ABIH65_03585 [Nanoarchaeota archaeon]